MDAGITTAATATGSTPGASPAGLFGALAGAKSHGPMSGFQALLDAFFGHQGMDVQAGLVGADPTTPPGKAAFALKVDNKAGHMTMDDALNSALEDGAPSDDKTQEPAAPDIAAANTGLSADAQALAALFAAPLQKAPPAEETTAKPPVTQAASANQAGLAADATVDLATVQSSPIDLMAAAAGDEAKADAAVAADQAAVSTGRAKLVEFAEALAANRNGIRAATAKAADAQPGYQASPTSTAETLAKVPSVAEPDLPAAAETVTASAVVEAEVAEAELPTPAPLLGKDRGPVRSGRTESAHKDAAASQPLLTPIAIDPTAKPVAVAANAFAIQPGRVETTDDKPDEAEIAPLKVEAPADDVTLAQAPGPTSHAAPAAAQAATAATRGAPETVASLAAQIIKKAEGRATRFDVELHPADLGRVDVRLEIGAHGRLTASMSFENPHAAAELRGRADELQRALENAGFDLSGGLSFDVAGDRSHGQNPSEQQTPDGGALRGRAFEAALATAGETANAALAGALNAYQSRVAPGLDIRI